MVALELVVLDDELRQVLVHLADLLERDPALPRQLLAALERAVPLRAHLRELLPRVRQADLRLDRSALGLVERRVRFGELLREGDVHRGERVRDRVAHRDEDRLGVPVGGLQHHRHRVRRNHRRRVGGTRTSRRRGGRRKGVVRLLLGGSRWLGCLADLRVRRCGCGSWCRHGGRIPLRIAPLLVRPKRLRGLWHARWSGNILLAGRVAALRHLHRTGLAGL